MFSLQDALPASLSAVDDSLVVNAPELTTDQVTAATETQLYIQTVAKGIVQKNNQSIDDPNLYKSDAWYRALTDAVADYADWVEIVGAKSVAVNNSTHSGSINLSAIMGSIMTLYLGPTAAAEWSTLSTLLGGAETPGVTDFMDFWWSRVQKSTTDTGLSVGPNVETSDGEVQWAICYYSMTHVIDDWRTMFVSATYESFDVAAAGLTLKLDQQVYVDDAQAAVRDYLRADITNKIHNAPIPRPSKQYELAMPRSGSDLVARILSAPRPTFAPILPAPGHTGSGGTGGTGGPVAGGPRPGGNPVQVSTRDVHDVSVLPLNGDPLLAGAGLGHLDFAGPDPIQLRCGPFASGQLIPTVGQQYQVTGLYDDTDVAFSYTLNCTQAGRPVSYFGPATN